MKYFQQTRLGEGSIHKKYLQFKQKYPSNYVREKQFYDCIIDKVRLEIIKYKIQTRLILKDHSYTNIEFWDLIRSKI